MKKYCNYAAALIVLLGLFLRIYQLGHDSFWFDEAGVAYAACASSPLETLEAARSHAAAMPLDYLLTWVMARVSVSEAWLRLPSALWGTAAIFTAYILFSKLAGKPAALFASLFLALSPLHLEYSQELRFYSGGVFFYLLSTLLIWNALHAPVLKNWLLVIAITTIGGYYYLYAILSLMNGLSWMIFSSQRLPKPRSSWRGFSSSSLIIGLLFLPGFIVFAQEGRLHYGVDPIPAAGSFFAGMGWLPASFSGIKFDLIWGGICFLLFVFGAVAAFHKRQYPLTALALSGMVQAIIIFSGAILTNYFITPRQFLTILPISYLFSAYPLIYCVEPKRKYSWITSSPAKIQLVYRIFALLVLITMLASVVSALRTYYQYDKSRGRQISTVLAEDWKPGEKIWVFPWYEPLLYQFYLEKHMGMDSLSSSFIGIDALESIHISDRSNNTYLVTPSNLTTAQLEFIDALGFKIYRAGNRERFIQVLWRRSLGLETNIESSITH